MLFGEERPAERASRAGARTGALAVVLGIALAAAGAAGVWGALQLEDRAEGVSPAPGGQAQVEEDGFAAVDWDWWAEANPDVIGWVDVPGTDISQPICRADASDPAYWNDHDAYGSWNYMGCPFLDSGCEGGLFGSANAVVQGHNVGGDGSGMFAQFADYADAGFAQSHKTVHLQDRAHKAVLEVFCAETVPNATGSGALAVSFDSPEQFRRYVAERVARSAVVLSGAPEDGMWSFSTCSYFLTPSDERTVVHCKLASMSTVVEEGGEP